MAENFIGTGRRLRDIDIPKIGASIGVGEDEVHAFLDVESRGTGFDDNKRPRILFERHIFLRYLPESKKAAAIKTGLADKAPGGYGKEADQYGKLERAMAIDRKAALYACSWGIGQTMGFNHVLCGYSTVDDMIKSYMDSEANQLQGAINFVKNSGLANKLKSHDWAGFARGYNGSNYKINKYDEKLEAAYKKWAKIPDTPYPPNPEPVIIVKTPEVTGPIQNVPPAKPTIIPTGKSGWTVLVSIVLAFVAAVTRYFGGL